VSAGAGLKSRFQTADMFCPVEKAYQLAPFRFARIPSVPHRVLLVNEVGEFAFLAESEFATFCNSSLDPASDAYRSLRSKHFLLDEYAEAFWPYAVSQYRTRKSFIVGGPALHIVVVTLRCDHSCSYCQVSRQTPDASRFDMTEETAAHVTDRILESPADELKVEFQGGESLLGFARIRQLTEAISVRAAAEGKRIEFVVASTLNELTDEQLEFLREHRFHLSTSIDGPAWLHNRNRARPGKNSYEMTVAGIARARAALGNDAVGALVTLTRDSLSCPEEIIDTYVSLGFSSIFLRPLSQYGFAKKTHDRIGYSQADFLKFYDRALSRLVDLNSRGIQLEETYAAILMKKILTPYASGYVDLCSPAGAMLGALVYNYDGGVYASDEGRMLAESGDFKFRLGNVCQPRHELFASDSARQILAASVAESLPGCADCAFVPYCGADPVGNHAETGSLIGDRRISSFCQRHTGLFHRLFAHLADPSSETARLLSAWAFGRAYSSMARSMSS
jgi:His-Xaa-Ser system radical SAM maturase HxsB